METCTPGYSEVAAAFMARRRLDPNGAFFLPHLKPGISVLDCSCGPGTITRDIARQVLPGRVSGVDFSANQVALATREAKARGIANAEFRQGSVYEMHLPTTVSMRPFPMHCSSISRNRSGRPSN